MKRLVSLFLLLLLITMSACADNSPALNPQSTQQSAEIQSEAAQASPTPTEAEPPQAVEAEPPQPVETESPQEPENIATLCVDFSCGNAELDIQQYEWGYDGEFTPEVLLEGLTELTGLDFIADVALTQMGITVDWKKESTLIANLDDREQKEAFRFSDADSMRWFMMDSLYRTLIANYGEDNVFYTMDVGKELAFDELHPTNFFPFRIPYMGSPFYFAHADGRGLITNEDEASSYLLDTLTEAGYDMDGNAIVADPDGGDPWFGEMAVWYFSWGANSAEKFTAEKIFAVTYDWQVWEYDALNDEWVLWH